MRFLHVRFCSVSVRETELWLICSVRLGQNGKTLLRLVTTAQKYIFVTKLEFDIFHSVLYRVCQKITKSIQLRICKRKYKGDLRDDGHILKIIFAMILNIFQLSQPMCQLYKIPISTRFILSYANNVYLGDIILVMIALTLQCTNKGSQGRWNV